MKKILGNFQFLIWRLLLFKKRKRIQGTGYPGFKLLVTGGKSYEKVSHEMKYKIEYKFYHQNWDTFTSSHERYTDIFYIFLFSFFICFFACVLSYIFGVSTHIHLFIFLENYIHRSFCSQKKKSPDCVKILKKIFFWLLRRFFSEFSDRTDDLIRPLIEIFASFINLVRHKRKNMYFSYCRYMEMS